jgi:hypothetical protein
MQPMGLGQIACDAPARRVETRQMARREDRQAGLTGRHA